MTEETIKPNCLPTLAEIPDGMTKGELASLIYPDIPYDYALPQGWVDQCQELGFDPRPCFVWGYPNRSIIGQPLPLTAEGARDIPARMIWAEHATGNPLAI